MCNLYLKRLFSIAFLLITITSCSTNLTHPRDQDYSNALKIYDSKNYTEAFSMFESLAKIGEPSAQHSLWVMYSNGEGVKKDFYQGFAWLAVAADSGDEDFIKEREDVLAQLTDKQRKKAEKEAKEKIALYGMQAQKDTLTELLITEPVFVEGPIPNYPTEALNKEIKGYVILELTVTPEGKTRDVRVIESSDKVFEAESIKAAEHYTYQPVKKKGQSIETANVKSVTTFRLAKDALTQKIITNISNNALDGKQDITDVDLSYLLAPKAIPILAISPPIYPEAALRVGVEGRVRLAFTITQSGVPQNIKVIGTWSSKKRGERIKNFDLSRNESISGQTKINSFSISTVDLNKEFERSALRALKKCRFTSDAIDGKPIEEQVVIYNFWFELENN